MKQDRIQDLKRFEERIFDTIQEYVDNEDNYPTDAVLQIDSTSMRVLVDSPSEMESVDNIPLLELISINDKEVDCDRIYSLVNKYMFI